MFHPSRGISAPSLVRRLGGERAEALLHGDLRRGVPTGTRQQR